MNNHATLGENLFINETVLTPSSGRILKQKRTLNFITTLFTLPYGPNEILFFKILVLNKDIYFDQRDILNSPPRHLKIIDIYEH